MMISNIAAGSIAMRFGAKGPCLPVVTACATSTHAIGEAYLAIAGDRADVIVPAAEIFLRIASVTGERPIIVPTIGIIDGIVHSLYVRHLEQEAQDL